MLQDHALGHVQGQAQPHADAPSVATAAGVTATADTLGESHSTASTRAAAGCTLPAAEGYTCSTGYCACDGTGTKPLRPDFLVHVELKLENPSDSMASARPCFTM